MKLGLPRFGGFRGHGWSHFMFLEPFHVPYFLFVVAAFPHFLSHLDMETRNPFFIILLLLLFIYLFFLIFQLAQK